VSYEAAGFGLLTRSSWLVARSLLNKVLNDEVSDTSGDATKR